MLTRMLKALNATFFAHVIARLGSFVLVPLFLSYWAPARYGEWLTMFAAVSYLATLDFGVQVAAVNRLTRDYARNDIADYRRCQHSALMLYVLVAAVGTVLMASTCWLLPLPLWIGIKETDARTATSTLILLGIYTLWAMPAKVVTSIYQTTGNLARSQWVGNVQQLMGLALTALILVAGGGMIPLALAQVSLLGGVTIFVWWDLKLHLPALSPGLALAKIEVVKELLKPSLLFALLILGNLVVFQGSILLVSIAIGGITVALFSITRTLSLLLRQIVDVLGVSIWPDLARMEACQEFDRMRQVHALLVALSGGISAALAASFWFEGSSIITIWTQNRIQPDTILLRLLLVYVLLESPWLASAALQAATNRHRRFATSYIIAAVSGILLATLLVKRAGAWAIPIGLIAGETMSCYHFVIRSTCQMIQEPYEPFARHLWFSLVVVSAAAMGTGWVAHNAITGPIVVRWIVVALSTSAASVVTTWCVWLNRDERSALLATLRALVAPLTSGATAS
jgi:O-antigen/teichoic acid export membrane protein